jgi:hypothetical protein
LNHFGVIVRRRRHHSLPPRDEILGGYMQFARDGRDWSSRTGKFSDEAKLCNVWVEFHIRPIFIRMRSRAKR